MDGKISDLGSSFTKMINKMVADAAAANLTQYFTSGNGGGMLGSILGSTLGSNLFGINGSTAPTGVTPNLLSGVSDFQVNLPGFATGGEFKVGGTGGTDSQVVAFRASPNETVSVRTPAQQSQASTNNANIKVVINTPNADSFVNSRDQVSSMLASAVRRGFRNQ